MPDRKRPGLDKFFDKAKTVLAPRNPNIPIYESGDDPQAIWDRREASRRARGQSPREAFDPRGMGGGTRPWNASRRLSTHDRNILELIADSLRRRQMRGRGASSSTRRSEKREQRKQSARFVCWNPVVGRRSI